MHSGEKCFNRQESAPELHILHTAHDNRKKENKWQGRLEMPICASYVQMQAAHGAHPRTCNCRKDWIMKELWGQSLQSWRANLSSGSNLQKNAWRLKDVTEMLRNCTCHITCSMKDSSPFRCAWLLPQKHMRLQPCAVLHDHPQAEDHAVWGMLTGPLPTGQNQFGTNQVGCSKVQET